MISIDATRCSACGICGRVCPRYVPETVERDGKKVTLVSAERQHICMDCGQCALVCEKDAIRVDGLYTYHRALRRPLDEVRFL